MARKTKNTQNSINKTDSTARIAAQSTHVKEAEVEVLYQRMGERWYAFSLIEDEVFFGAVTEDAIAAKRANPSRDC